MRIKLQHQMVEHAHKGSARQLMLGEEAARVERDRAEFQAEQAALKESRCAKVALERRHRDEQIADQVIT